MLKYVLVLCVRKVGFVRERETKREKPPSTSKSDLVFVDSSFHFDRSAQTSPPSFLIFFFALLSHGHEPSNAVYDTDGAPVPCTTYYCKIEDLDASKSKKIIEMKNKDLKKLCAYIVVIM